MLVCPTSLFPICPSGSPTASPLVCSCETGNCSASLSRFGVPCSRMAFPSRRAEFPQPSRTTSSAGRIPTFVVCRGRGRKRATALARRSSGSLDAGATLDEGGTSMTKKVFAVLACAGAALACSGGGSGGGSPAVTPKGWTVLVYMVADNNLESFAIPNLQQMATVGSSDNLRIVVELDRSLRYSTSPIGNIAASATTKRLLVQNGSFQQISDLGNLDTANPATLADFIQWGIRTYPSQNYALVLWDHGGGWKYGFGEDEPTGHMLGLAQMQQALKRGLAAAGVSKLQILGFDACLMSTFEVMQALQPYATYLVASEETEPGAGWDYTRLVPARDSAAVEAVTLAKGIVDGYAALNASDSTLTLALTD